MTWTFSDSIATDKDIVRLKVGDTDTNDQLLSDETIDALLAIRPDVVLCAIDACRAILAKLARDIDRSAAGMSGSRSQKTQHYKDILSSLVKESGGETRVKVGGISKSENDTLRDNSDFEEPTFAIGMNDRVNSSGGSNGDWG
jgi:hypothetical protein